MSHVIPPLEELKWRAYCKFHNTFSHATNDCNVLQRQIQSTVNESRIIVPQMKVDQNPFPAHTHVLELSNPKVLIRPSHAESTKGKNIIVGEERSEPSKSHKEALAKNIPEDSLKNSALGGQEQKKDVRSTQTDLTGPETGPTGPSGISKKNSRNNKKGEAEFQATLDQV